MIRLIKIVISVICFLLFAAGMFYCLVAGAPESEPEIYIYIVLAFLFSAVLSAFLCLCIWYINYLHKIIEKKEKNSELDKSSFLP